MHKLSRDMPRLGSCVISVSLVVAPYYMVDVVLPGCGLSEVRQLLQPGNQTNRQVNLLLVLVALAEKQNVELLLV